MSGSAVLIGEILVGIIQLLSARAIAAGVKQEDIDKLIKEAFEKAQQSDPGNLPDL